MLMQRIITAIFLLAVIVGALWISPLAFTGVAALAIAACLWEWLRLCRWPNVIALVSATLLGMLLFWIEWAQPAIASSLKGGAALLVLCGYAVVVWIAITAMVFARRYQGWKISSTLGAFLAWTLLPCAWFALMYLYHQWGTAFMLSVLLIVWIADIGAYFFGRLIGGAKMAPAVSPGKTWAGALAAMVLVTWIAYAVQAWLPAYQVWSSIVIGHFSVFASALIILVVVLFSIAGDLFESALKRSVGVKDSSALLPGHGGFYDRLDAQIPVLPTCVFILLLIQGY